MTRRRTAPGTPARVGVVGLLSVGAGSPHVLVAPGAAQRRLP